MKKIIGLFLCLLPLMAWAENFSHIYFTTNNCAPKANINVYVGNRLAGSISAGENIDYKIYSQGRISVVIEVHGFQIERFVTIENGKKYYFEINSKNVRYGLVDEKIGETYVAQNPITIPAEEDLTNPVGKLPDPKETNQGQATCFLINREGYLLTNYHVIENTSKVFIKGIDGDLGTRYEATVVAHDVFLDLALLKLKDRTLQFGEIPYALSDEMFLQGSHSFVLGYPLTLAMGEEIKVTEGIVSANSGLLGSLSQYQFSASVQPGNSGSPLFNDKGEVIGVINSKLGLIVELGVIAENTGYAIKSQFVQTFLKLSEIREAENKPASMADLSLPQKIQKLKRFIFIVITE